MAVYTRNSRPTPLNTAVVSNVKGVKTIDQARAEAILTKFIESSEVIASSGSGEEVAFLPIGLSNAIGSNPILGQLKRVQRDLRGLPPLMAELESFINTEESADQSKNKSTTFENGETSTVASENTKASANEVPDIEADKIDEVAQKEPEISVDVDAVVSAEKRSREDDEEDVDLNEEEKQEKKRQKKLAKKEKKEKKEKKVKKEKKEAAD